MKDIELEPL